MGNGGGGGGVERGNLMLYAQSASAVICGRNRKRGIERKGEGKKSRGRKDKKRKGGGGGGWRECQDTNLHTTLSTNTFVHLQNMLFNTESNIICALNCCVA